MSDIRDAPFVLYHRYFALQGELRLCCRCGRWAENRRGLTSLASTSTRAEVCFSIVAVDAVARSHRKRRLRGAIFAVAGTACGWSRLTSGGPQKGRLGDLFCRSCIRRVKNIPVQRRTDLQKRSRPQPPMQNIVKSRIKIPENAAAFSRGCRVG